MSIPNIYLEEAFVRKLNQLTFCGPHAWSRLLSWLEVDQPFQEFMQVWEREFLSYFHDESSEIKLPLVDGLLEPYFEDLYPSQFILRMAQLANTEKLAWLLTALNDQQQLILLDWLRDSQIDRDKGIIADHWYQAFDQKQIQVAGADLFAGLTAEIMHVVSGLANPKNKRRDVI